MQAYIGIIMLAGIVVSNAILLVDYINTLRRRDGMPLREAVELGGRTRLRPILMTSIACVLGLVPMAIGVGEGGELQAPLARVVVGGLITSTIVTLVLVPAVYTVFEEGWSSLWKRGAKHAHGGNDEDLRIDESTNWRIHCAIGIHQFDSSIRKSVDSSIP
jgi:HAE1 family hydrophobic/amphiphilic exporter-1